jgi:hypothetical protein
MIRHVCDECGATLDGAGVVLGAMISDCAIGHWCDLSCLHAWLDCELDGIVEEPRP